MDIYELAEIMHEKLCHYNHTDYCSWYYENEKSYPVKDKWLEAYTHKDYLARAIKVRDMTGLEFEDIAKVMKAL